MFIVDAHKKTDELFTFSSHGRNTEWRLAIKYMESTSQLIVSSQKGEKFSVMFLQTAGIEELFFK